MKEEKTYIPIERKGGNVIKKQIIDRECQNCGNDETADEANATEVQMNDDLREAAIHKLQRILAAEQAKPETQKDYYLIDDCIKNIAELKGVRYSHTPEELEQKSDDILKRFAANTENAKPKRPKSNFRFIAILAAALLLIGSISAYAFNQDFRQWILTIITMPVGSDIEVDSSDYDYLGKAVEYSSISEFLAHEPYHILYPGVLPDGVSIDHVIMLPIDPSQIIIVMSDTVYSYSISLNHEGLIFDLQQYELYNHNDITFYIKTNDVSNRYDAIFQYKEHYYSVAAPDYDSLILILDNLQGDTR